MFFTFGRSFLTAAQLQKRPLFRLKELFSPLLSRNRTGSFSRGDTLTRWEKPKTYQLDGVLRSWDPCVLPGDRRSAGACRSEGEGGRVRASVRPRPPPPPPDTSTSHCLRMVVRYRPQKTGSCVHVYSWTTNVNGIILKNVPKATADSFY